MQLYDPARRRIGTTPALTNRLWAVPQLSIWPAESGSIQISAMIPADSETDSYLARQVSNTAQAHELPELLLRYRADPEQFLESFFHITLEANRSRTTKPNRTQTILSHDDIGV